MVSTDGTDRTPVTTEECLAEVHVPFPTVISGISFFNGSVASGNIQGAIRDSGGNVLATTASTAMSGTDAYQKLAIATTYQNNNGTTITSTSGQLRIDAGTYYVALQVDNTTARTNTHTLGSFGAGKLTSQTYGTFVAAAMPVTFTTALGPIASLY